MSETEPVDLFIIGGGVNGCGIARDASGRGLSVALAEQGDLASATSSASTKLFHGGLRYLEFFKFRLVRESLAEREVLLQAMPHISWPMRFVLPYHRDMRFDTDTPTARLLSLVMPWLRGRRPAWLIRLGLFLYDHLGGRKILPGTISLDLNGRPEGEPLQERFRHAFEYSDCWVEDSRLVVLNARDAQARGAEILTRTRVVSAARRDDLWQIVLEDTHTGERSERQARMLVNAAGPWVAQVLHETIGTESGAGVRLVRGSHIITRRLFDHDKAYFFQGTDGRIVFAIPYETDFTLIGTTDVEHAAPDTPPECSEEEKRYLLDFAAQYFKRPLAAGDVVWSYSGVRPLYDDGASSATGATRDYVLTLDREGAPLLNVFGGKITTYRRLAQAAMAKIGQCLPLDKGDWTSGVPLPGGDFPVGGVDDLVTGLRDDYPFLDEFWARRLVRAYGTEAGQVLGDARDSSDMGEDFGASITARELNWSHAHEFTRTAEDFIWRRSKLGLRLSPEQVDQIDDYLGRLAR